MKKITKKIVLTLAILSGLSNAFAAPRYAFSIVYFSDASLSTQVGYNIVTCTNVYTGGQATQYYYYEEEPSECGPIWDPGNGSQP